MSDTQYKPIDKAFHTILQDLVARQRYCRVQYFTPLHEFITARTVVKNLVKEAAEEY